MELICPKCRGTMRSYERSGITVDQCSECRGIFLDRGELERLVDAETAFHAASAAGSPAPAYGSPSGERYRDDRYKDDRYKDDRYREGYYDSRKRKKRSFLEDLFD